MNEKVISFCKAMEILGEQKITLRYSKRSRNNFLAQLFLSALLITAGLVLIVFIMRIPEKAILRNYSLSAVLLVIGSALMAHVLYSKKFLNSTCSISKREIFTSNGETTTILLTDLVKIRYSITGLHFESSDNENISVSIIYERYKSLRSLVDIALSWNIKSARKAFDNKIAFQEMLTELTRGEDRR